MDIINILKRKSFKKIHTYIKHKKSLQAFTNYVDSLGNDKSKLKKINVQLGNLSKTVKTLPKLFKSFTSIKRSKKIKETVTYKQALPLYEPDIIENVEPTIRKTKREKKEQKKINRKIRQVLPNFIDDNNDIVVIRPRKSQPKKLQKINKKTNKSF